MVSSWARVGQTKDGATKKQLVPGTSSFCTSGQIVYRRLGMRSRNRFLLKLTGEVGFFCKAKGVNLFKQCQTKKLAAKPGGNQKKPRAEIQFSGQSNLHKEPEPGLGRDDSSTRLRYTRAPPRCIDLNVKFSDEGVRYWNLERFGIVC